jgi:hypothetical protein
MTTQTGTDKAGVLQTKQVGQKIAQGKKKKSKS